MKPLNFKEFRTIEGGIEPISGAAAVGILAVGGAAAFVGGALLAYGTYKLIKWAFE
jgi:lactobin A/cerein 7B family class IIb bacteriocin